MALPSGTITMQDLQNEYGGSNPASLSEYYRGGTYVNTERVDITDDSTRYIVGVDYWFWDTNNGIEGVYIDGVLDNSFAENSQTQYFYGTGNVRYYRAYGGGIVQGEFPTGVFYYNLRTWTQTTNQINTTVPASGTISLNNFKNQGN
jgi:hypothetical protein